MSDIKTEDLLAAARSITPKSTAEEIQAVATTLASGKRVRLIATARAIFDLLDAPSMPAFSHFRRPTDLIALIVAFQRGIFNYGVCVRTVDEGYEYPKVEETITALDLALEGKYDDVDLESLGVAAKDKKKLLPGSKKTTTRKPRATKAKASAGAAAKKPAAKRPRAKPAAAASKPEAEVPEAPNPEMPVLDLVDKLGAFIDERFIDLRTHLSTEQQGLVGGLEAAFAAHGRIFLGLGGMIATTLQRQSVIKSHLDDMVLYLDPHAETTDLPELDESFLVNLRNDINLLTGVEENPEGEEETPPPPEAYEEPATPDTAPSTKSKQAEENEPAVEENPEPAEKVEEPPASSGDFYTATDIENTAEEDIDPKRVDFSENALMALPVPSLKRVCGSVGIRARSSLRRVLVRRLMTHAEAA